MDILITSAAWLVFAFFYGFWCWRAGARYGMKKAMDLVQQTMGRQVLFILSERLRTGRKETHHGAN